MITVIQVCSVSLLFPERVGRRSLKQLDLNAAEKYGPRRCAYVRPVRRGVKRAGGGFKAGASCFFGSRRGVLSMGLRAAHHKIRVRRLDFGLFSMMAVLGLRPALTVLSCVLAFGLRFDFHLDPYSGTATLMYPVDTVG